MPIKAQVNEHKKVGDRDELYQIIESLTSDWNRNPYGGMGQSMKLKTAENVHIIK